MARVTYDRDVAEHWSRRLKAFLQRLERIIQRLEKAPNVSGAKRLGGELAGHWRTGDWRVQFRVVEDEVIIERVGHRDGFYD